MKWTRFAFLLLILPATQSIVRADVLGYASALIGTSTNSEFGILDLTTGVFTDITTYSNTFIADLALSPDETLYALTAPDGVAGSNEITTINTTSGAITDVAVNSAGLESFDFAANGTLYGLSYTAPVGLYTVDPTTGAAGLVANLSGAAADDAVNIKFIGNTAYTTDYATPSSLYTIDLTTGATALVGSTGFTEDNALIGEVAVQLVDITYTDTSGQIFYVNPANAATTPGAAVSGFYSVALIPTPEPASFLLFGTGILAIVVMQARKRS
jgi:hypothetical protein